MASFTWTTEAAQAAMTMYTKSGKDNSHLESIAKVIGTTVPSVRGKLAIMGVYAKPEKATAAKKGAAVGSKNKAETLGAIEIMLSIPKGDLSGLDKGTVKALKVLFEALKQESLKRNEQLGLKES